MFCYFRGSAFYVGVYQAMVERWGMEQVSNMIMTGDSAGSIFAVLIAVGRTPEQMDVLYREMVELCVTHGVVGKCSKFMDQCAREVLLDYPDAHFHVENRCHFGTTEFPFTHRWHSTWENNEDMLKHMKCSYHIPFYCARIGSLKGVHVVDGAYSVAGHDLVHGNETLFIGIDPHADVTMELTNNQMLYPATGDNYDSLVKSGYETMMSWDGSYSEKVGKRQPNYNALYVLWVLKYLDLFVGLILKIFVKWPMQCIRSVCGGDEVQHQPLTNLVEGGHTDGDEADQTILDHQEDGVEGDVAQV